MKYEYNFKNFHLPESEYKLLQELPKGEFEYNDKLTNLMKTELICYSEYTEDEIGQQISTGKCEISEKGYAYIQYRQACFKKNCYTVFIAIITILISIVGIIVSVYK